MSTKIARAKVGLQLTPIQRRLVVQNIPKVIDTVQQAYWTSANSHMASLFMAN